MNFTKSFFLLPVIIFLDQATKFLARLYLNIFYNGGISFALFAPEKQEFNIIFAVCFTAVLFLLVYMCAKTKSQFIRFGLIIIVSGALSNFLDRLLNGGRVVDWISIWRLPVFNLADAAISFGFILVLYDIYKSHS
ncbi:MAG: signal peptidase II [Patescibacteria group bacterium]|nr:signal peptidase II [Patescibacteria group bacterium]